MNPLDCIKKNNETHQVDEQELQKLIAQAQKAYQENFDDSVWFERSLFINWTCAIADCKYCYLSTKPKHKAGTEAKATRSKESILAEAIICKAMGWKIGYITGGLRVEPTEYLIELLEQLEIVLGHKVKMNFGPYVEKEILALKAHISGMGSAIESFDEELHSFICPSKPLKSLTRMLSILQRENIPSFITIILGMGEKKSDVEVVIENLKQYGIEQVQLCFLKPQENTVFSEVPPPDAKYMAWWTAKIRIALPSIKIKIALVYECMDDFALLLEAGANCFSRFMVFKDFNTEFTESIILGARQANRKVKGDFDTLPDIDIQGVLDSLQLDKELKERILPKAQQYYNTLLRKTTALRTD